MNKQKFVMAAIYLISLGFGSLGMVMMYVLGFEIGVCVICGFLVMMNTIQMTWLETIRRGVKK